MKRGMDAAASLARDSGTCDAELLSVFLMEADGILTSLGVTLKLLRSEMGNTAYLADLRRSFHAFKGSSRAVGLHLWAGAAAALEAFVKAWLAQADDGLVDKYALLLRAEQELHAWTVDIAKQGSSQLRPDGLIAALQAVFPGVDISDDALAGQMPSEVEDVLDLESLDIFLEEGRDLLWQIGDCLQRLHRTPDDAAQLQSLLRTMHTIKGSSRMAGAMRLACHMHTLESRIGEMTRAGALSSAMIDELLTRYDQGLHLFDALQASPASPVAAATENEGISVPVAMPGNGEVTMSAEIDGVRTGHAGPSLRIRAGILDKLINQAGEISISRSGLEVDVAQLQHNLSVLAGNVARLGTQLRQIEMEADIRISACHQKLSVRQHFDPLEFDRYTQLQESTRMLVETVDDVSSLQKHLVATVNGVQNHLLQQARITRDMQRELMHARMVQLSKVEDRLQRLVRQMVKETGKPLVLEIVGGTVEIDRSILEKMAGPFEHLLRNAVVHGLETRAERRAAGKDESGRLRLQATQEGNEVMIRVEDDGHGLKLHRIRAIAVRQGLISGGQVLSEVELTGFIFHPGFSTSATVTTIVGRGVGLDVVRTEVASLGGRISVESVAGCGTAFIIHLPMSLAVTQVVLVQAGGQTYAIPSLLVGQVLHLKSQQQEQLLRCGSLEWQGRRLVLHGLPDLLGSNDGIVMQGGIPILVIKSGHDFIALLVERVLGSREVVTKNIGPQLARFTGVVGATVLGDGSVVLILNPIQLVQRQGYQRQLQSADAAAIPAPSGKKSILVVDDSLTVRRVMQRLLTRAGYELVTATDGINALQHLQSLQPDIILIDIEMPRMDGFDLVRRLRDMDATATLPIIMITSRTAAKHCQRAKELGVNEYLGKPYQDEDLLKLIAALLGTDGRTAGFCGEEVLS